MSDQPLFQKSDEHEEMYTSSEHPETDDRDTGSEAVLDDAPLAVPAAGVLGGGLVGATGPGSGSAGTGLPSAASAELASETSDDADVPNQS